MEFRLFLLLIGLFILVGCVNGEEESLEITEQTSTQMPTLAPDNLNPPWPDQELLLHCTIEWDGKSRLLSTQYDPMQDRWYSKRILVEYDSSIPSTNIILADAQYWIFIESSSFDETSLYLRSYNSDHELESISIETEDITPAFYVFGSYEQPDLYLLEKVCGKCAPTYSWLDVNNCRIGSCQLQPIESVGHLSSRSLSSWSPDFKHLFMYDSLEQGRSARLILTDSDGVELYDFGIEASGPDWLDATTFGFWSKPDEEGNSIFYRGVISSNDVKPLFTESDLLSALPDPLQYENNYVRVNSLTNVGEKKIIMSLSIGFDRPKLRDEPQSKGVYNAIVSYDLSVDFFTILWQSFSRHNQHLSPDRTEIYIALDNSYEYNIDRIWQIIDLFSGEISETNWVPFSFLDWDNSLSHDTKWRVNFHPIIGEPDQTVVTSPPQSSRHMLFINEDGFEKIVEYPENISNCRGGWIFK